MPEYPDRFGVQWKNFHGFTDTGLLEVRPLTILIGPNNSGKTSLIKPLLLLKQTLQGQTPRPALVTRGELVNAGDYRDLITHGDVKRCLEFRLDFHRHEPAEKLNHVGHYPPGSVSVEFSASPSDGSFVLARFEVSDIYGRRMLRRSRRTTGSYTLSALPSRKEKPATPVSAIDRALRKRISAAQPEHFLFVGASLFSAALSEISHDTIDAEAPDEFELSEYAGEYMRVVDYAHAGVRKRLQTLRYLGPLRDAPRRLYEMSGESPMDVGVRGQFAPELIFRNDDKDFADQLRQWLKHFDLPADIACTSVSNGAFVLAVRENRGDAPVNFADIGFGMSQILPLIVQALLTKKGEYLLAEQPEIHLNPRLQAAFADLVCAVIDRDGGVILETHSEHLLTRVRRLVAESRISADDVAIYFVERDAQGSHVREVPVSAKGHIDQEDWPAGFFSDSLRESLLLAAAQRKALDADA